MTEIDSVGGEPKLTQEQQLLLNQSQQLLKDQSLQDQSLQDQLLKDQLVKDQQERVLVAAGEMPPEVLFKNATFVNVFTNELEKGDIAIHKGVIVGIGIYSIEKNTWIEYKNEDISNAKEDDCGTNEKTHPCSTIIDCTDKIICPGFIDGHIHIESSMLSPEEFAAAVVPHGTTTVITDPHEIANVAGTAGIDYMLSSTEGLTLDVYIMLPSCVPATSMDESGAVLEAEDLEVYFNNDRVLGLAELMNSYATIQGDEGIFRKLALAKKYKKLVDGHAPGLQGNGLNGYITAGVSSDHECSTVGRRFETKTRTMDYDSRGNCSEESGGLNPPISGTLLQQMHVSN